MTYLIADNFDQVSYLFLLKSVASQLRKKNEDGHTRKMVEGTHNKAVDNEGVMDFFPSCFSLMFREKSTRLELSRYILGSLYRTHQGRGPVED